MVKQDVDADELVDRISSKKPDLVEFRTDNLNDPSILEIIAQKKTFAAIATDKANREPAARRKLLMTAATAGFDFVDMDLFSDDMGNGLDQIKESGAKTIVSFHDWSRTPSLHELDKILNSAKKRGGDIYKIVTTAVRPRDNLTILSFLEEKSTEAKLVSFAMGAIGIPSRILSPIFGSEFAFAALNEESATADGQLSIDNLRSAWSLLGLQ
jgi:3-dehydroquinate dehydratase type I